MKIPVEPFTYCPLRRRFLPYPVFTGQVQVVPEEPRLDREGMATVNVRLEVVGPVRREWHWLGRRVWPWCREA